MTESGERERLVGTTIAAEVRGTGLSSGAPSGDDPMPDEIGRYRVVALLGAGGMGLVYQAHDPKLGRDVAVKLVRTSRHGRNVTTQNRSLREAQALAKLTHPNVVQVYDVGVADGGIFIAMEFLRGRTLSDVQRERPPWRTTLQRYLAAGEALAAAHAQGLVHRDFKPDNVMLTDGGEIKVLDFGLARLASEDSSSGSEPAVREPASDDSESRSALDLSLTTPGTFLGTPAYMAPEQFDGRPADARSDQFSFCVALWQAVYGQRPFEGDTLPALRRAIHRGQFSSPPQTDVPPALRRILSVGLCEGAADRHPSMTELLARLRRVGGGQRWWGLLVAGAVAFAVGISVFTATSPEPPCTGATAALGATWDDTRREAIRAVVLQSGHGYAASTWTHLEPRLDGWAAAWVSAHETICRASRVERTQSPEELDHRMACLERARSSAEAFLLVLAEGERDAVRRAVRNAARLAQPGECTTADDDGAVASLAPAVRQQISLLGKRLDEATARAEAGELGPATELAMAVAAEAREFGATELRIDAMLLEADQRERRGERHAAESTLRDAYLLAVEADDAARAARAARSLVFVTGVHLARYDGALEWHRHARAQLDRLPTKDPLAEAALLGNLGAVQGNIGDFEASTESQLRALALERSVFHAGDLYMVPTYANLSNALVNEQRYAEAIGFATNAVRLIEDNLGQDHPDLIGPLEGLATAQRLSGDCPAAMDVTRRALIIARANFGEEHITTGRNLLALAACETDPELALATARTALAIHRAQLGDAHPDLISAIHILSGLAVQTENFDEGIALLREGVAIQERIGGPEHPDIADHLVNLGTTLREVGRLDEAIETYERAALILADTKDAAAVEPFLYINLGLALHDAERWSEAAKAYASTMDVLRRGGEGGSLMHLQAQSSRGEALLRLGETAEALSELRDAHAHITAHTETEPTERWRTVRADTQVRLAAALVATGGAPSDEVRSLAQAARAEFVALGDAVGESAAQALLEPPAP